MIVGRVQKTYFGDGKLPGSSHPFIHPSTAAGCDDASVGELAETGAKSWKCETETMVENIKRGGPSKGLCQGSLNYPFWGIKQCKRSVRIFVLQGFPLIVQCLGW